MRLQEAIDRCDALLEWYYECLDAEEGFTRTKQLQDIEMLEFFLKLGKHLQKMQQHPYTVWSKMAAKQIVFVVERRVRNS